MFTKLKPFYELVQISSIQRITNIKAATADYSQNGRHQILLTKRAFEISISPPRKLPTHNFTLANPKKTVRTNVSARTPRPSYFYCRRDPHAPDYFHSFDLPSKLAPKNINSPASGPRGSLKTAENRQMGPLRRAAFVNLSSGGAKRRPINSAAPRSKQLKALAARPLLIRVSGAFRLVEGGVGRAR